MNQSEFNKTFITGSEICQQVGGVSRAALSYIRKNGIGDDKVQFPEPIEVLGTQVMLWNREQVKPFIELWRSNLRADAGNR